MAVLHLKPTVGSDKDIWGTKLNNYLDATKQGINVKEYGAVGDGVTDDTTAIQAAIDSAYGRGGGEVFLPSGQYLICSTIYTRTGVRFIGTATTAYSEIGSHTPVYGSTLIWGGANDSDMVVGYRVSGTVWDGISFYGNGATGAGKTGITGIYYYTDNNPVGLGNKFTNFEMIEVDTAMVFGEKGLEGGTQYQTDNIQVDNFRFHAVKTGIQFNSQNAGDYSTISNGWIVTSDIGFDLRRSGTMTFSGVAFGTSGSGASEAMYLITSVSGLINIFNSQSEGTGTFDFIKMAGTSGRYFPVNVYGCAIDQPIRLVTTGGIGTTNIYGSRFGGDAADPMLIIGSDQTVNIIGCTNVHYSETGSGNTVNISLGVYAVIKKKTITTGSLTTADCGYVLQVSADAQIITLPATVAGVEFTIMCTASDGNALLTIELDNSDKFIGAGFTPIDGEAMTLPKATQNRNDYIKVAAHIDGWIITEMVGTWAEATP